MSSDTERVSFLNGNLPLAPPSEAEKLNGDIEFDPSERDVGGTVHLWVQMDVQISVDWVPGQGVRIDYDAIIEILIQQLDPQRECAI